MPPNKQKSSSGHAGVFFAFSSQLEESIALANEMDFLIWDSIGGVSGWGGLSISQDGGREVGGWVGVGREMGGLLGEPPNGNGGNLARQPTASAL